MGAYLCYDLDSIFRSLEGRADRSDIFISEMQIPADTAFMNNDYNRFRLYKRLLTAIQESIKKGEPMENEEKMLSVFIDSNPEFYTVYDILGQYFQASGKHALARKYYTLALTKEIASKTEKDKITERMEECSNE